MSTHIAAQPGELADTVLLPGDPLRAKYVAEKFLGEKNRSCFNTVRNMLGFSGFTEEGKYVSVQGAGIGMPSLSTYVNELVDYYGVKRVIRIGTCGSLQDFLKPRDIVLAQGACTDAGTNRRRFKGMDFAPIATWQLLLDAYVSAKELSIPAHIGNILATDLFYNDVDPEEWRMWAHAGVLAIEMETAELYTLAALKNFEALTILTVSDSLVTGERLTAEEREKTLEPMVRLALSLV